MPLPPTRPCAWCELSARAAGLGRRGRCRHLRTVLSNLAAFYGEDRYRVSPLIQQAVFAGEQDP